MADNKQQIERLRTEEENEALEPRTVEAITEAADTIERLEADWQPRAGHMHPIDQSLYDLTVKERDYERVKCQRLEAERDEAKLQHVCEGHVATYDSSVCWPCQLELLEAERERVLEAAKALIAASAGHPSRPSAQRHRWDALREAIARRQT